jgi:alpha-mannosidase
VAADQELTRLSPAGDGRRGRLYVVAISHLDTQWRWTIQDTIRRHLPRTLRDNFAAFRRFPRYVLSFDGAFRYRLVEEYFRGEFETLKSWVAAGRWAPAGSFWESADVNLPSPESLIRQILHGRLHFRRELGVEVRDLFLPDCFGFGFALPSIAAHCGVVGFSSQKLSKGRSAIDIPFALGVWEGPDGAELVAALAPGGYGEPLRSDLARDPEARAALDRQAAASGVAVGMRYFGVGDTGGAPDAASLGWLERSLASSESGNGAIEVRTGPAGRLFAELTAEEIARLPRYRGELLLSLHATGGYTSQAAMKRWNRKNELLADAAERAAVAAHWLGAASYPRSTLGEAWRRVLAHQFHDDLPGTSVPEAYRHSWNDEILSLNQFAEALRQAVAAVARGLDTRGEGVPLVVFNPLSVEREEVVEARLRFPGPAPPAVRVYGPRGEELPAQARRVAEDLLEVIFVARLPAVGWAVFDVRPAAEPGGLATGLDVAADRLENERYRVGFDREGSVASVLDKALGRELLAAPLRLELLADRSLRFPAWEIRHEDVSAPPRGVVGGPPEVAVEERGPARAALEVRRRAGSSTFVERWRLAAGGAGGRLEADVAIDWRTRGRLLKAAFPLAVGEPVATYDLGLGVIERGVNSPRLYEVPAQQWADLSERGGGWGVAILNDCKYGWDRPAPATLRLTLLHTPRVGRRFRHQGRQDLGRHRLRYALAGHAGDWRAGEVVWQAARLNQPPLAFQAAVHGGELGKELSLLQISSRQVAVRALKLAEASDELVVRLQELAGRPAPRVELRFPAPVVAAREINGAEESVAPGSDPIAVRDGVLVCDLGPFAPRACAIRLAAPAALVARPVSVPLDLAFDLDVVSRDDDRRDGDFDGRGRSLPGELLPRQLGCGEVEFRLGASERGARNALACRGQLLELPAHAGGAVYLLAAAAGGEARVAFQVGEERRELAIAEWCGPLGRWGAEPRRDAVAWVGGHRHSPRGDEPYEPCYLFVYRLALPATIGSLGLPAAPRVRILAITVASGAGSAFAPAGVLYD